MSTWFRMKMGIVGATAAVCVSGFFVRPSAPRRIPEPKPAELYAVVLNGLQAESEGDFVSAYRQASLSMQERYNLDAFAEHARTERPGLRRFERVEFGALRSQGRVAWLTAYLFLPAGEIAVLHYTLVREEGTWRIEDSRLQRRWTRNYRVGGTRL